MNMMHTIYNVKTACIVFQLEDISCYGLSSVQQTLVWKRPLVSKHLVNVREGSQRAPTSSSSVYSSFSSLLETLFMMHGISLIFTLNSNWPDTNPWGAPRLNTSSLIEDKVKWQKCNTTLCFSVIHVRCNPT
jgi:hypothetical protein